MLTNAQLDEFKERGFVKLGRVGAPGQAAALAQRIDDLMMGKVRNPAITFQLDSKTGNYEDVDFSNPVWKEATLKYRKIEKLDQDPLFWEYTKDPFFVEACRQLIGPSVKCFRTMFMNKPAGAGTHLPYHQDAGAQWGLSKDPFVTIWTALDPATKANGCVEVVPGTHKLGLMSTRGHVVSDEKLKELKVDEKSVFVELEAGESFLMHNSLFHRSGRNGTTIARRAYSVCYMDGETVDLKPEHKRVFPYICGEPVAV
ncbi:MAG: phytanoyl-CoA dioxygenase family protein [Planctomycetota bacterium]|nr:phytanoyl-CoA dioxygenase family protein [Planctomycetota bacterium]